MALARRRDKSLIPVNRLLLADGPAAPNLA
jgi:hypothetical protein